MVTQNSANQPYQTNAGDIMVGTGGGSRPTILTQNTNGQLVIGSTGVIPVVSTLTAGTGISITNGAGSITISSTGGSSSTAGSVYLSTNKTNVTGNGTSYLIIFDTVQFDGGSNYNNSTGVLTIPQTGVYSFTTSIAVQGLASDNTGLSCFLSINSGSSLYFLFAINPFATQSVPSVAQLSLSGAINVYLTASTTVSVTINGSGHASNNISLVGEAPTTGALTTTFGWAQIG